MGPLGWLIHTVIELFIFIVIAMAVMSWLIAFGVVNTRNDFVRTVANALYQLTEPVLRPIRNALPNLGGLDLSPVVLIIGLMFLQRILLSIGIYP